MLIKEIVDYVFVSSILGVSSFLFYTFYKGLDELGIRKQIKGILINERRHKEAYELLVGENKNKDYKAASEAFLGELLQKNGVDGIEKLVLSSLQVVGDFEFDLREWCLYPQPTTKQIREAYFILRGNDKAISKALAENLDGL